MGMTNPHNPEQALWDAYMTWTQRYKDDPHSTEAKGNSEYYYDQFLKQTEKRVAAEIREHRIKETAGDKLPKVKPKADKLKS